MKHQCQSSLLLIGVASTAGIYHLDLKPDNILLVSRHPESAIKVADFGLARSHTKCASGDVGPGHGTRGYMAPEAEKQGYYTHYSEIYGVGAVLYALLIGEKHYSWDKHGETPATRHVYSLSRVCCKSVNRVKMLRLQVVSKRPVTYHVSWHCPCALRLYHCIAKGCAVACELIQHCRLLCVRQGSNMHEMCRLSWHT